VLGNWSVKDVLAHLVEWEQMVMQWVEAGVNGKTPAVPSEEYNWGELPQLNQAIYLKYRDTPLAEMLELFSTSHKQMLKTIEDMPEKDLFTRKTYAWTNNNLLAAYFVSATSSHYRWARTELRKGFKKSK